MTATVPARVYTGATPAEIARVFAEYVAALTASDGPLPAGSRKEVADQLAGFVDAMANQIGAPADDRDVDNIDEWRRHAGLCPDAGDHLYGPTCRRYECATWLEAEYEDHVADTGRLR